MIVNLIWGRLTSQKTTQNLDVTSLANTKSKNIPSYFLYLDF